ncbi:unnamed protein product [Arctogadus glacialis]
MGLLTAAESPPRVPRALRRWRRTAGSWVWITLVSVLASLPVEQLCAFPSSLSDCQTPTGWNCSGRERKEPHLADKLPTFFQTSFDDRDTDLFLCDTNTCKFDGECLRIGDTVTCICDFKPLPQLDPTESMQAF